FRERGPGDVELGCHVGDRATEVNDLYDGSLPSNDGQRRITVMHGTGLLLLDSWLQHAPSCSPGTRPLVPYAATTTHCPAPPGAGACGPRWCDTRKKAAGCRRNSFRWQRGFPPLAG